MGYDGSYEGPLVHFCRNGWCDACGGVGDSSIAFHIGLGEPWYGPPVPGGGHKDKDLLESTMRILTADQEITRLTQERDEARDLVKEYRVEILGLTERAARAEGESFALEHTVEALRKALELMRSEQDKTVLERRIAELEREITQCLTRMTAPSVVMDGGRP